MIGRSATGPESCNLLVTTSVAEEGLDFPQCNAVISADGISNDIGLVQRKGRARSDGVFIVMVNGDKQKQEYDNAKCRLANAQDAMRKLPAGSGRAGACSELSVDESDEEVIVYTPVAKAQGADDSEGEESARAVSYRNERRSVTPTHRLDPSVSTANSPSPSVASPSSMLAGASQI
mmetsp:Transcript_27378/g.63619  ORF Transcript_27378/g.63619 Transcript_27378/m.63619 type:complete len:177 (-) Transcript_27378:40-570(-)